MPRVSKRVLKRAFSVQKLLIFGAFLTCGYQFHQLVHWTNNQSARLHLFSSSNLRIPANPTARPSLYRPRVVALPTLSSTQVELELSADPGPRHQQHPRFPRVSPYSPLLDAPSSSIGEDFDQSEMEEYLVHQFTNEFTRDCRPMSGWQHYNYSAVEKDGIRAYTSIFSSSPPLVTCNLIHELSMWSDQAETDLAKKLGQGGWRYTFQHRSSSFVFKMYRLDRHHAFGPMAYERHRVDALLAERLTSSPHSLDIYGYCGMTGILEAANMTLDDWIRQRASDTADNRSTSRLQLLRLAYQLAKAVADLHTIDGINHPVPVVHRDLKTDNCVIIFEIEDNTHGINSSVSTRIRLKLNDFNDSVLRYVNHTATSLLASSSSHEILPCPFFNEHFPIYHGLGYTPAEMSAKGYPPLSEKLDSYGLGAILYHLLVGRRPYSDLRKIAMAKAIKAGRLPSFPHDLIMKRDQPMQELVRLIQQCLSLQSQDRPSAIQVSDRLGRLLQEHT